MAEIAGCRDGVLADPRAYFFALIGRVPGAPAPDWFQVLTASGIPRGPKPGERQPPGAPHYGITQAISAEGVRGRLFLPTDQPDDLNYFTHRVDVLDGDPESPKWAWKPLGGPLYAPRPCASAPAPGGGSGPPATGGQAGPEGDILALIDVAMALLASIDANTESNRKLLAKIDQVERDGVRFRFR